MATACSTPSRTIRELIFADLHESGHSLYPGTGRSDEIGRGAAAGTKLNVPLPAGAGEPSSSGVAAACWRTWSASNRRSSSCSAAPTASPAIRSRICSSRAPAMRARRRELCLLADRLGHGRVLALGGGGYDRGNLARTWSGVVRGPAGRLIVRALDRVQFRAFPLISERYHERQCRHVFEPMLIKDFDPELQRALDGERQRQEDHIELIASENYASPLVLEAQGSVLTNKYAEGYPGQALLRRLRIRRHRRAAGDRPGQEAVRGRLRQRAAALGLAGQCGGLPGAAVAGRCDPRHEPRSRRPPDPRRQGQFLRQAVPGVSVRRAPGHRADRLRADRGAGARAPAEDDRGGLLGLFARARLAAACAPSPTASARCCSSTWRTLPGWWPPGEYPEPAAVSPTWSPPPRTRPCAGRAAA